LKPGHFARFKCHPVFELASTMAEMEAPMLPVLVMGDFPLIDVCLQPPFLPDPAIVAGNYHESTRS
jgi:hypothetical protein